MDINNKENTEITVNLIVDQSLLEMILQDVTRVEVIEQGVARHFCNSALTYERVSLQDGGKTIKIFVKETSIEKD